MIAASHLFKTFKLYHSPADRLRELAFGRAFHREHAALRDVSFTVAAGETIGIIGRNGAGKSTLLKLLMGILLPDSGTIELSGRITGLLELTTGFNPECSGMRNIYLNGIFRGMSRRELDERLAEIVAFSELGDFIDAPLKTYSTGMVMRLAFAIAIHADPQGFAVDEALSVGDAYFQQKCIRKINAYRSAGGSILLVSHDMNTVKLLCDRVLLLDQGQVIEQGEPEAVINGYNFLLARKSPGGELVQPLPGPAERSYGNLAAEINSVALRNAAGAESGVLVSGAPCAVEVRLTASQPLADVTVGMLIRDRFGQDIFGTNTHHAGVPVCLEAGRQAAIRFSFDELNIGSGKYSLTVAAHSGDVHVQDCYHWMDTVKSFEVVGGSTYCTGLVRLKPSVLVSI